MARIDAEWKRVRIPAGDTATWAQTRKWLDEADARIGDRAVYVIRTTKPFSIAYKEKASPVLYIGEGDFGTRLKSHLKNWIHPLAKDLPNLAIELCFADIRVRNNPAAHRDVEADMLWEFSERYGSVPLMNRQLEYHSREHSYSRDFFKPLLAEKGRGYLWAIRPLISNMAYPASLKGSFE